MIWILFLGTMALSLWAMWRVKSVYRRHSQGVVRSGLTGGEVAGEILRRTGIRDVEITHAEGMLGDHYEPIDKRLVFSTEKFLADRRRRQAYPPTSVGTRCSTLGLTSRCPSAWRRSA